MYRGGVFDMTPLYAGVGGVVRELTEMDAGINGAVKSMTEMWAGVDGVNRQIFSKLCTVRITGFGSSEYEGKAQVEIEGVVYYRGTTLQVPPGTQMIASAYGNPHDPDIGGVYVNEKRVVSGEGVKSYIYTIETNISIELISMTYPYLDAFGEVRITEEA